MPSPVRQPAGALHEKSKELDDKCLAFIADFVATNGYPPSVRAIGAHMGYTSSSTTQHRLGRLQDSGRLIASRRGGHTLKLEVVE